MGNVHYLRGPLPRHLQPTDGTAERRRPAAPPPPPARGDLPTEYRRTAHHVLLIANPNRCGICRRPRHQDTAHHQFEPDLATVAEAEALGWPIPRQELPS